MSDYYLCNNGFNYKYSLFFFNNKLFIIINKLKLKL